MTNFAARRLLQPVFTRGKLVYERVGLEDTRQYCAREVDRLWDTLKRFENPQTYYVDLSQKLWDIKDELLHANKQLI